MARYFAVMTHFDDGITFQVPGLPGFFVQTETCDPEAAVREAESVLADYLGTIADSGRAIPAPVSWEEGARIAADEGMAEPDSGLRTAMAVLIGRARAREPMRVNVSFASDLLEMIDENSKARGLTRSGYLAEAARAFG